MEAFHQIEIIINIWLQSLGSFLTIPMQALSFLGQEEFYIIVLPGLYWCIDARLGLKIGAMLVLSGSLNDWLKMTFASSRPFWISQDVKALGVESSFGVPSGHAMNSTGIFGLLALLLRRAWFKILVVVVVFLIGLSRLYLGLHYASDVLLGWAFGGLLVFAFVRLQGRVIQWIQRQSFAHLVIWILVSSLGIVAVSFIIIALNTPWNPPPAWIANASAAGSPANPYDPSGMITFSGIWLGLAGGAAWLHSRQGLPKPGATLNANLLRYIIGVMVTLVLWYGLGAIFPRNPDLESYILRYLRYALLGAWVSILAPLLFIRLKI